MASLTKWLSVRLQTKGLWFRVQLQSLNDYDQSLKYQCHELQKNKDVPSENTFHLLLISFDKLLMYIKNNKSLKIDPCSTPAQIST